MADKLGLIGLNKTWTDSEYTSSDDYDLVQKFLLCGKNLPLPLSVSNYVNQLTLIINGRIDLIDQEIGAEKLIKCPTIKHLMHIVVRSRN